MKNNGEDEIAEFIAASVSAEMRATAARFAEAAAKVPDLMREVEMLQCENAKLRATIQSVKQAAVDSTAAGARLSKEVDALQKQQKQVIQFSAEEKWIQRARSAVIAAVGVLVGVVIMRLRLNQ